jgi:hypothetical protein
MPFNLIASSLPCYYEVVGVDLSAICFFSSGLHAIGIGLCPVRVSGTTNSCCYDRPQYLSDVAFMGYDFMNRFAQMTYFMLCALTTLWQCMLLTTKKKVDSALTKEPENNTETKNSCFA